MISAKPNLNGNSVEDFGNAYCALLNAQRAIDNAARVMLADVVAGRNYQHLDSLDDAVIADRRKVQRIAQHSAGMLGELMSDLADIVEWS